MPVAPKDIGWARYLQYVGPFYGGKIRYETPQNPTWEQQLMSVITATEGGKYDAINMYDRMIWTVGVIQWGEAGQYSVSDMMGAVVEKDRAHFMEVMKPCMNASNVEFKKNAKGRYRFFFRDSRGEVDRLEEQQQLFLLHSDGTPPTWDDESKAHAKLWAACSAMVWESDVARQAQIDFTVPRLMWFHMPEARKALYGNGAPGTNDGWAGALRAAYVSFAANLPAVASKMLLRAIETTPHKAWSPEWCIAILKELTFGPKIAIYPHRYNAIRPVLEKFYGIDVPDFAKDLEQWKAEVVTPVPQVRSLGLGDFDEVVEYQRELLAQGYNLGPAGADGVMGRLTKAAIVQFQAQNGLEPDGIVGSLTRKAFLNAALKRHGEPPIP